MTASTVTPPPPVRRSLRGQKAPTPPPATPSPISFSGRKSPDTCAGAVAGGESGDVVPEHPERPVAAFVRTLFSLLNGPYEDTRIAWSDDGERIVVADPSRFAAEVCPKFFRHKNWNSFSRMLNMYEFHKVPAGAHGAQVHVVEFRHAAFRRGGGADLWTIVRKKAKAPADGAAARASPKRPRAAAKPKRAARKASSPKASVAPGLATLRRGLGGGGPRVLVTPPDLLAAVRPIPLAAKAPPPLPRLGHSLAAAAAADPPGAAPRAEVASWMRRAADLESQVAALQRENALLRTAATVPLAGAGAGAGAAAAPTAAGAAPVEHWFGDLHPDPATAEDWALAPGGGAGGAELRDVFADSVAEAGAPDALALRPALGFDPMDLDDVPHHASPGFMAQIHDFVASGACGTCCASPAMKA